MNPIEAAFEQGYDENRILSFFQENAPHARKKIAQAIKAGYSAKDILNFFSSQMSSKRDYGNKSQQAIHTEKRREDTEKNKELLKQGVNLATSIGAGALIGKAAPKIGQAIAQGLTKGPKIGAQAPIAEAMKPAVTPGMNPGYVAENMGPEAPNILRKYAEGVLKGKEVPSKAKGLLNAQALEEQFKESHPKVQEKDFGFKDAFGSMKGGAASEQLYEGLFKSLKEGKETFSGVKDPVLAKAKPFYDAGLINSPADLKKLYENKFQPIKPEVKIEKQVLLPSGEIGTFKGEKQGIGSYELPDGKIRNRKVDEVIEEPEEAAVKAQELIKSFTPEQERSAHHALSFYNPEEKKAFFMFHDGSAYQVDDIHSDEYERLSKEVDMAKTSGETSYGAWATGHGSRGAAYNEIVKKLKKPYKKLAVGYNLFGPFQKQIREYEKRKRKKQPE